MLVAPAATPRATVERLSGELRQILALPEVKEAIVKYGFVPMDDTPIEGLQAFIRSEIALWRRVVEQAGIAGSE
jgi:tripartite-type tricarboxylate transporter receptor subunit TctC